jgi:cold shock CspA family protein/ribosome-associated translation inhibitor RaiA
MSFETQITFRGMEPSPAVEARIREHAERLLRFHDRITSCRVVIQAPHRRHHKGRLYEVRVDLKLPGREIAVTRDPSEHHAHEDVYVAIRDAFDAVARRLEDAARERRGDVKSHEAEPHGRVSRLFRDQGYGFIKAANGDEVYFHSHAVANEGFGGLKLGSEVRYQSVLGEKGLQATIVKPVGKHHLAP